jgi:RNA polymerase sigma-70 factor (ECF subfamily)
MDLADIDNRLSRIQTCWTLVLKAHQGQEPSTSPAFGELLLRYYGAVYRYLLGALRSPTAAEELTQEFAVRFLRGDFKRADPGRGRFRDFLKTAVRNLLIDHWRTQGKEPTRLAEEAQVAAGPSEGEQLDEAFLANWRDELLARTWAALEEFQTETGQPYHAVLDSKTRRPEVRSAELAQTLAARLGRPFSADGVRQLLHRARERFADLLVDEVARSLQTSEPAVLEQELIDLDLLSYCGGALQRRGDGS